MDNKLPLQDYNFGATETAYPQTEKQYFHQKVPISARKKGWCALRQKNKPQSNSVGAAAFIFTSGGMSMAWSLGFSPSWHFYSMTIYMTVCWFVMAIAGAAASAAFANVLKKKTFMLLSSILVLLGGILFLSLPNDTIAIMTARHLNGFAGGLVLVPTLIMGGEEVVPEFRGMITSSIATMYFSLGAYLQISYTVGLDFVIALNQNQLHGILLIAFSAISLRIIYLSVIESPVYFLMRNQEQAALECLRRLQNPCVVNFETYEQLEALKSYVACNREMSRGEAMRASLPALFKLCILRAIIAMSFSSYTVGYTTWPAVIYGTFRFIGIIVGVLLQDTIGRKLPLAFGMLTSGAIAIGIAICFTGSSILYIESTMLAAIYLLLFYQFFAGLVTASSSAYLSEAFPLAVKPYCIAIAFTVEMLVQVLCASFELAADSYYKLCYVLGVVSLIYSVLTIYCLPETKKTTLHEAQIRFQVCCNKRI